MRVARPPMPSQGRRVDAGAGLLEHLVVVAQQRDQAAAAAQVDQSVEHSPAVRPSVDIIAQRDEAVLRAWADGLNQGVQGR